MKFCFPPQPVSYVPIVGQEDVYPVSRIFCVGRNYAAHAEEMGDKADKENPFYFNKNPSAIVQSGSEIPYPSATQNYHYEMELVFAMGDDAVNETVETALNKVFAYGCGLDMTRRDLQKKAKDKARPWDTAKDFEQSAILAPLHLASEVGHMDEGRICLKVNDEARQDSDLSMMINSVGEIVSHLSTLYHLKAGDLIFTGTPAGVGAVEKGDVIVGSIAGLGEVELKII